MTIGPRLSVAFVSTVKNQTQMPSLVCVVTIYHAYNIVFCGGDRQKIRDAHSQNILPNHLELPSNPKTERKPVATSKRCFSECTLIWGEPSVLSFRDNSVSEPLLPNLGVLGLQASHDLPSLPTKDSYKSRFETMGLALGAQATPWQSAFLSI